MPTKLQVCEQMAEETANQITGSHESWTDFLKTAGRLYKYPYHEQLMIYTQRPEAAARAEYGLWNRRIHQLFDRIKTIPEDEMIQSQMESRRPTAKRSSRARKSSATAGKRNCPIISQKF